MTGERLPGIRERALRSIRAFGALRTLLLLVFLVSVAFLWLRTRGRLPETTIWQVPLVLELLLLTLPWRVVSAGKAMRYFLIGLGPIFLATVVSQWVLEATPLNDALRTLRSSLEQGGVGFLGDLTTTIWAPLTEELWKVVPVIAVAAWGSSRLRKQGGPLDFALLAVATGAGMGMAEDLFRSQTAIFGSGVPASPLLGLGVGTAWAAIVVNPLNADPISVTELDFGYQGLTSILVPSVRAPEGGPVWVGHGVTAGLFGLALGWVAMIRRGAVAKAALVVPVAVLAWSIWHHFVANWYLERTCGVADAPSLCTLTGIGFNGAIYPIAAIAAWVLATIGARRAIARYGRANPGLALSRSDVSTAAYRGTAMSWPLRFAGDLLQFVRLRNRLAFAAWRSSGPAEPLGEGDQEMSQTALLLAERLRGPRASGPSSAPSG